MQQANQHLCVLYQDRLIEAEIGTTLRNLLLSRATTCKLRRDRIPRNHTQREKSQSYGEAQNQQRRSNPPYGIHSLFARFTVERQVWQQREPTISVKLESPNIR